MKKNETLFTVRTLRITSNEEEWDTFHSENTENNMHEDEWVSHIILIQFYYTQDQATLKYE